MRVLYFNNCWFTNVGEAFIDIGGMHLVREIFPKAQIACMSAMTNYYVDLANANSCKNRFRKRKPDSESRILSDMSVRLEADYVVLPGMFATEEYLQSKERRMIDELCRNGTKAVFLGMGGATYKEAEIEAFKRYLEEIRPAFITSRDNATYENYKNAAPCIRGIDCAFWTAEEFDPRGFARASYDIVAFNRMPEPEEFNAWPKDVIRPWHMQASYTPQNFKNDILMSDTPYDYLTAYANAECVYTDLVHATIISLMYGVPVKYWYFDKRSFAFDALDDLKHSSEGFLSIDSSCLLRQKDSLLCSIKTQLERLTSVKE